MFKRSARDAVGWMVAGSLLSLVTDLFVDRGTLRVLWRAFTGGWSSLLGTLALIGGLWAVITLLIWAVRALNHWLAQRDYHAK
ncbi:hypothetical protein D1831_05260 [Lactiplantibacillus garii]|uniref:Integral membrane protein n=1 Tax=Lactiplantibacillus garii TaxID=2306423 RepID=A0A3R8J866_9LACO|nr:hypothetical protein [Lactiplantibacillus garii]RRK10840.1 hypothetical protein D1831_05260 [Lactiplantibacillus garii]